eukprot:COSAG04_NODE_20005_length_403_cov_0.595395_1_plen_37_part_01
MAAQKSEAAEQGRAPSAKTAGGRGGGRAYYMGGKQIK